jgi:hypothetical protein
VGLLITFYSTEGQFTEPSGVAVNAQNDIIVADTNNHRIQIFDKEGRFKFQFGEVSFSKNFFCCLSIFIGFRRCQCFGSGFNQVSGSGFGIRNPDPDPLGQK